MTKHGSTWALPATITNAALFTNNLLFWLFLLLDQRYGPVMLIWIDVSLDQRYGRTGDVDWDYTVQMAPINYMHFIVNCPKLLLSNFMHIDSLT